MVEPPTLTIRGEGVSSNPPAGISQVENFKQIPVWLVLSDASALVAVDQIWFASFDTYM